MQPPNSPARKQIARSVLALWVLVQACHSAAAPSQDPCRCITINLLGVPPVARERVIRERIALCASPPLQIRIFFQEETGAAKAIEAAFADTDYEGVISLGPHTGLIWSVVTFCLDPVHVCTIYGTEEAPLFAWLRIEGVPHGWALGNGAGLFVPRRTADWFSRTYKDRINSEIEGVRGASISWEDDD